MKVNKIHLVNDVVRTSIEESLRAVIGESFRDHQTLQPITLHREANVIHCSLDKMALIQPEGEKVLG